MLNGPSRFFANLLADIGERPIAGTAGASLYIGPFVFRSNVVTDLASATDETEIIDLGLQAQLIDPQLNQIEPASDRPEIAMVITSVRLYPIDSTLLGRDEFSELQQRTFLMWRQNKERRYFPLGGAWATSDVGALDAAAAPEMQAAGTPGRIAPWLIANLKTDRVTIVTVPGPGGAIVLNPGMRFHIQVGGLAMPTDRMRGIKRSCEGDLQPSDPSQIRAVQIPARNAIG